MGAVHISMHILVLQEHSLAHLFLEGLFRNKIVMLSVCLALPWCAGCWRNAKNEILVLQKLIDKCRLAHAWGTHQDQGLHLTLQLRSQFDRRPCFIRDNFIVFLLFLLGNAHLAPSLAHPIGGERVQWAVPLVISSAELIRCIELSLVVAGLRSHLREPLVLRLGDSLGVLKTI
jgi:hypothetical protein